MTRDLFTLLRVNAATGRGAKHAAEGKKKRKQRKGFYRDACRRKHFNVCQCSRGNRGMSVVDCICPSSIHRITPHTPQPFVPPLMVCGYHCCPHAHVPAFSGILHGEKKHRKADYRKWAKSTLQIHLHLGAAI